MSDATHSLPNPEEPATLLERALADNLRLAQENLRLADELARLRDEHNDLRRRLEQSSLNSNTPPSADPPHKRTQRPKRPRSSKKQGAQPGHKGHRFLPLTPDKIVDVLPPSCHCCNAPLKGQDPAPHTHQVIDIPPFKPEVIDYKLHRLTCGCGAQTKASLPAGVPHQHFGPRVRALYIYLIANFRMSRRQAQEMLHTVVGTKVSLGTLNESEGQVSECLTPTHDEIKEQINQSDLIHVDETGWYKNGELYWLWYAGNKDLSYFKIEKSRSKNSAFSILEKTKGIKVTDRFPAYTIINPEERQLCWAHLKRDFVKLEGVKYGLEKKDSGKKLLELTQNLFKLLSEHENDWKQQEVQEKILDIKGTIRFILCQTEGREKKRSWINRIINEYDQFWTWMNHPHVPLTNNEAERSLRHGVILRKITFGNKSDRGLDFTEALLSVVQTLKKRGRPILDYLESVFDAMIRKQAIPQLL